MSLIAIGVWILSYLLGSIPFGIVLAKFRKVDLRQQGSGNIGATNVARTLGKTAGLLTLAGDGGKGFLSCWVAGHLLSQPWEIALAGLLAYSGHVFSIFLKFKGGKGVATGLGVFLYLMPWAAGSVFLVFVISLATTRYVSVSSLLAAVGLPLFGFLFQASPSAIASSLVMAGITIYKHRENIRRLRAGTENKFRPN